MKARVGRLRVSAGRSPLRAEHDRLIRVALRRGDPTPEQVLEGARLEGHHSSEALSLAADAWRARMVHEHRSAAVFARLLPQLMAAEAPLEYRTTVLRMGLDELRHAALCGQVVTLLGQPAEATTVLETTPLPEHEDATPREAALRNVLFVGCLSETVAISLLAEERELCREPAIAAVLEQLQGDEVLHAKLGWSYLAELAPALDASERQRLDRYLRVAFGHLEAEMHAAMPIGREVTAALRDELESLGCTLGQVGRDLFAEVVEAVIVPRLEDHGLDAKNAWTERVRPG